MFQTRQVSVRHPSGRQVVRGNRGEVGPPLTEGLNIQGSTRVGPLGSRDMQGLAVVLDEEEKVENYQIQERTR